MCKEENLGEPIYSSKTMEVFHDDLKESKPPEWMKKLLFEDTDNTDKDIQSA